MDNPGLSGMGDTRAAPRELVEYVPPKYPHIYTGGERRQWCRIIPGRVGPNRNRWMIELDTGERLDVPARAGDGEKVERTEPCPACNATGTIKMLPEPKMPAITVKCKRCRGSRRSVRLPPFPTRAVKDAQRERERAAESRVADPVSRPGKALGERGGRINLTRSSGDWSGSRRDSSSW